MPLLSDAVDVIKSAAGKPVLDVPRLVVLRASLLAIYPLPRSALNKHEVSQGRSLGSFTKRAGRCMSVVDGPEKTLSPCSITGTMSMKARFGYNHRWLPATYRHNHGSRDRECRKVD
jgi:hypothetical protein